MEWRSMSWWRRLSSSRLGWRCLKWRDELNCGTVTVHLCTDSCVDCHIEGKRPKLKYVIVYEKIKPRCRKSSWLNYLSLFSYKRWSNLLISLTGEIMSWINHLPPNRFVSNSFLFTNKIFEYPFQKNVIFPL